MSYNEAPSPTLFTLSAKEPSECQACEGHGRVWRDDEVPEYGTRPCEVCQGTGHNLRGYLTKPPKVL